MSALLGQRRSLERRVRRGRVSASVARGTGVNLPKDAAIGRIRKALTSGERESASPGRGNDGRFRPAWTWQARKATNCRRWSGARAACRNRRRRNRRGVGVPNGCKLSDAFWRELAWYAGWAPPPESVRSSAGLGTAGGVASPAVADDSQHPERIARKSKLRVTLLGQTSRARDGSPVPVTLADANGFHEKQAGPAAKL